MCSHFGFSSVERLVAISFGWDLLVRMLPCDTSLFLGRGELGQVGRGARLRGQLDEGTRTPSSGLVPGNLAVVLCWSELNANSVFKTSVGRGRQARRRAYSSFWHVPAPNDCRWAWHRLWLLGFPDGDSGTAALLCCP